MDGLEKWIGEFQISFMNMLKMGKISLFATMATKEFVDTNILINVWFLIWINEMKIIIKIISYLGNKVLRALLLYLINSWFTR